MLFKGNTDEKSGRVVLVILAAAVILVGAEPLRERFSERPSDLRAFDAAMPVRQMITLLRIQYGMRPVEAVTNAYRAAHAAFVFKAGRSRADYEKALPDLEAYYRDIAALSARPFDADRAAKLELEWWIVHRENRAELPNALAALQAEIYAVPASRFAEHARLRAEAMDLRDGKGAAITEADWQRIGEMLAASWNSLHAALNVGSL